MKFQNIFNFLLKPHWLLIFSLSLTACGGGSSNNSTTNNSVAVSSSSVANSTSSINGTSSSVQTSSSIATTSSSSNTTTSSSIATTSSSIGSSSSSSSSVILVVDNLAPTISLAASTTNITVATTLNLTATANDNVGVTKVEFYDGASLISTDTAAPFTYSVSVTSTNNGTKSYTAKAFDAAGNSTESSAISVVINIDSVAPTVSLASSSTNVTTATSITLTATATDNVGVSKVEFYDGASLINSDTASPYSYSIALTSTNNGTKNYTAKAYDAAGNLTTSNAVSVTINIDSTAPTISLAASSTNILIAGNLTLTATATDNVGVTKVEFYDGTTLINTDTASPYAHVIAVTSANNGTKNYTAKTYDAAGNIATSAAVNVTIDIDTVAPTVSLSSSSTNITSATTLTLTATATDNKAVTKVEFYDGSTLLNTDTTAPYTYAISMNGAQSGTHYYLAKAYDASNNLNNSNTVNVVVNIDDQAPSISISMTATNITFVSPYSVNATATDNVGVTKVEFYIGANLAYTDTSSPYAYAFTPTWEWNGNYVFSAKAFDAKGNVAASNNVNAVVNIPTQNPIDETLVVNGPKRVIANTLNTYYTTSSYAPSLSWDWQDQDPTAPGFTVFKGWRKPTTTGYVYAEYGDAGDALHSVGGLSGIYVTGTPLAVGRAFGCALKVDGSIACWGDNFYGSLGNNSTTDSSVPVTVSGITGAKAVEAGEMFACAIKSDDTVACWGQNDNGTGASGMLGNNSTTNSPVPVSVSGLTGAVALAVGDNHSCAITAADNKVKCWGNNSYGTLGNYFLDPFTDWPTPVEVTGFTDAVAVSAGSVNTCAIKRGGTVWCWGHGYWGQLGNGTNPVSQVAPVQVVGLDKAISIAVGDRFACAVTADSKVWCWGYNLYGQLGNNSVDPVNLPVQVQGVTGTSVSAGANSACLTSPSGLYCWGNSGWSVFNSLIPMPLNVGTAVYGALGSEHGCALLNDGAIKCWGRNAGGALGNGSSATSSSVPVSVSGGAVFWK